MTYRYEDIPIGSRQNNNKVMVTGPKYSVSVFSVVLITSIIEIIKGTNVKKTISENRNVCNVYV